MVKEPVVKTEWKTCTRCHGLGTVGYVSMGVITCELCGGRGGWHVIKEWPDWLKGPQKEEER
jgi:DnaJ-class molecular chaperone